LINRTLSSELRLQHRRVAESLYRHATAARPALDSDRDFTMKNSRLVDTDIRPRVVRGDG